MRIVQKCFVWVAALIATLMSPLSSALAQPIYDKIEVGQVISGGIKLGTFAATMPLPPGQWQVVVVTTDKIGLSNGSSAGRWNYLLKDSTGQSPIYSLLVSITPDSTNRIDWTNALCQSKDSKTIAVDDFGTSQTSLTYACFVARKQILLRSIVASAADSKNNFVKNYLALLSPNSEVPDQAVELQFNTNKYAGRQMRLTMYVRSDGGQSEAVSAIKAYAHETGQAMLDFLAGKESNMPSPLTLR